MHDKCIKKLYPNTVLSGRFIILYKQKQIQFLLFLKTYLFSMKACRKDQENVSKMLFATFPGEMIVLAVMIIRIWFFCSIVGDVKILLLFIVFKVELIRK